MDRLHAGDTSSFEDAGLSGVVAACERFEAESRAGGDPRIADFLEDVAPAQRDRLLRELLAIEIELRAERGESPTPRDFLDRYPDWSTAIADVFSRETFESRHTEHPPDPTAGRPGQPAPAFSGSAAPGLGDTAEYLGNGRPADRPAGPLPERFGRYRVIALLGRGGFGRVYLAHDDELGRKVAIKVLHPGVLRNPGQLESFLAEPRMAAGLAHPGIVRVYDFGRHGEGEAFVVFESIDGRDLGEVLRSERPAPAAVAALLARVAEAAHHAHAAGLVHRDLKPSNILVDRQGLPHIADFGLAVREAAQHVLAGEIAGTPAFMAPEQVRGETHRLDARTDVWALGVILYLALTGRSPFRGRDRERVFRAILESDPKPPRQLEAAVPRELERIALKCLAGRMTDRYESAAELADDLNSWLAGEGAAAIGATGPAGSGRFALPSWRTTPATAQAPIVPKGLRAFDPEDADFFPGLVPGPRDREGLPESIRAWRRRIEEPDPARSFPVGLIYGPSGGGKSSFVRAGLIPRLARWIRPVYVEAAAEGTEARLLAALVREYPGLPEGCGLPEAAAALREGRAARGGTKVLLVLDQFEQWLHAHPEADDGPLVRALRQCDGAGLQAVLLVRDDFWMAIARFLRVLEVRPVEGFNSAAIEPFEARHAGRVLAELGLRPGRLHDPAGPEEARFLERAVKELAGPDGRIIPVRLTLLAETLRHRDWTPATLRELGGFEGIGMRFLEETFCAPSAPPAHRAHQQAAQAVLKALLPEPSSDLKGRMCPASALRTAAGYDDRPADFDELMALLDNELRMVTPVDPDGAVREDPGRDPRAVDAVTGQSPPETRYYQLTHDYLVPPVRQWLTRKQRETRRGRAELRLAAIAALWRERPESRRLPSLPEWLLIVGFTRPAGWSDDERRMMRAATRHHLLRAVAAALLAGGLGWMFAVERARDRDAGLMTQAIKADYRHLTEMVPDLEAHRDARDGRRCCRWSRTDRRRSATAMPPGSCFITTGRHRSAGRRLRGRLLAAQTQPDELEAIRAALAAHPDEAGGDALRRTLADESAERLRPASRRLRPGGARAGIRRRFRHPGALRRRWPRRSWSSTAGRSPAGSSCWARPRRACPSRSARSAATAAATGPPGWSPPRPSRRSSRGTATTSCWPAPSPKRPRTPPRCSWPSLSSAADRTRRSASSGRCSTRPSMVHGPATSPGSWSPGGTSRCLARPPRRSRWPPWAPPRHSGRSWTIAPIRGSARS